MSSNISDLNVLSIDICVCTYRRPQLAATLASLSKLIVQPNWHLNIIVADNDEIPSAQPIVVAAQVSFPFPIAYTHAPARNISVARNACLDKAAAEFVAFIDDDECASPEWLTSLVAQQSISGADVVLGPVKSHYPTNCAAWLKLEDFHSIKPVWVNGEIITGYTSNVLLLREAPSIRDLRFDMKLGRSGGEDTVYFAAIHKNGGKIDFAPNATVTEDVAPERLNFLWLLKRAFRSGQTHALLLLSNNSKFSNRILGICLATSKAIVCSTMAIANFVIGGRVRYWALRGALHVGVVAKLLGLSELIQYG